MAESRSIFQFKEFQLAHGAPGLKIGTEACIFGAYLARWANGNMLEIGTGCGILPAMVAQFHPNKVIDTLEIESEVANLAKTNFKQLPFSHQINIFEIDCKNFKAKHSYDFIFSNPPFFVNHLANSSKTKQTAMHSEALSPKDLADLLPTFTHENSEIALIYPPDIMKEMKNWLGIAGFGVKQQIDIIPVEGGKVLRQIVLFSKQQKSEGFFSLLVKNKDQTYTKAFQELLRPYYLIFP